MDVKVFNGECAISDGREGNKCRPVLRIRSIFQMECNASCFQQCRDVFIISKPFSKKEESYLTKKGIKYLQIFQQVPTACWQRCPVAIYCQLENDFHRGEISRV